MSAARTHRRVVPKPQQTQASAPVERPSSASGEVVERWFVTGVMAVVGIALAVRLLHVWALMPSPFFDVLLGDARSYDQWARRLAAGDWLGNAVFYQAPLYPYFLGVLYRLGSGVLMVRVVQAGFGAAACGLLALATRRFFTAQTGLIAGVALALYAPAIFFDGLLQKSALDTCCLAAAMWVASGLLDEDAFDMSVSWRRWLGLGLALGALSLTRENALVFVLVVATWIAVRRLASHPPLRARVTAGGVFALGLALVLVPVAVRNAVVGGGFYLTTSQFGPNFYIGNNPASDGTYMSLRFGRGAPEYEQQDATTLAEHAVGRRLTPDEVSSYWTRQALHFIAGDTFRWVALEGRKALLLVNAGEMLDTESQESYAEWSLPLRLLGWFGHFGVLVPLAVLGAVIAWPRRERVALLYGLTGVYSLSVLMFYVFARYRLPLVPLLLPFAADALTWAWNTLRHVDNSPRPPAWAFAVAAVVAVPANWPLLPASLNKAITETNLATELQSAGQLDDAVTHYQRAIALQPDYAPAYNNLGVALRAQGRLSEAISTYRLALEHHDDYPDAHYNLANALLAQGDAAQAEAHFATALKAIPDEAGIRNNLGVALAQQGRPEQALAALRAAVEAAPDSVIAHRNLGDVLIDAGQAAAGIAELQRATMLGPGDAAAHYDLGVALLAAERLEEAASEFRKTLSLTPNSEDAHNNLGIALGGLGRYDEAEAQFRAALASNPQSVEAQKNLDVLHDLLRQAGRTRPQP